MGICWYFATKKAMLKIATTAATLFVAAAFCHAQHIIRKASLGIGYYPQSPDSLTARLGYTHGAIVKLVMPNTTAAATGILPNDIITAIKGVSIDKPADILLPAKALRSTDKVTIKLIRGGKEKTLSGNAVAKPMETSANATVAYGEFAYKGGYVRTIYKSPKGAKPKGAIYFLQGLPCYSMDNFSETDITGKAINAMVDRGFAVYRMEKADMGDNMGMPPCERMGYNDELDMYDAGYRNLLGLKGVDTAAILLFGHSMGGVTAPLLAARYQPKAIVVYGTVFKPWMDYLLDAYVIQSQYYGDDLADLRQRVEQMKPYAYDYFYGGKNIDTLCATEAGRNAMSELMSYDTKTGLAASGRSPLCHKELNEHNVALALKNSRAAVLAIYGECDIAANNATDHQALINYVNLLRPGKGTFWQAPGTTHTFEEIGTMEQYIKWQADVAGYSKYAATKFNTKVFDYACQWMERALAQ